MNIASFIFRDKSHLVPQMALECTILRGIFKPPPPPSSSPLCGHFRRASVQMCPPIQTWPTHVQISGSAPAQPVLYPLFDFLWNDLMVYCRLNYHYSSKYDHSDDMNSDECVHKIHVHKNIRLHIIHRHPCQIIYFSGSIKHRTCILILTCVQSSEYTTCYPDRCHWRHCSHTQTYTLHYTRYTLVTVRMRSRII